jgi:HD-GYP domain-containing protein (c-di-GMP phosphodiesterase class II)
MSWEVAEAAARELLDAYLQALQRGDYEAAEFWRRNASERIVNLNDAIGKHLRESGRADGAE